MRPATNIWVTAAIAALASPLGMTASAAPGDTTRVSVASDGTEGNDSSWYPQFSPDDRYLAFGSLATNLVMGDTNNTFDWSGLASISANGRYVAFSSDATNLIPNDANDTTDVFVHDTVSGEVTRVSVSSDAVPGDDVSVSPSVSADGRHVAFWSYATNLVPNDTNEIPDVFVHDTVSTETNRVSVASDGTEGNDWSEAPVVSVDGRFVAFHSDASRKRGSPAAATHPRTTATAPTSY